MAAIVMATALLAPCAGAAATNQELIDKYNAGGKLTTAEIQQLKGAGIRIRGTGKDERIVIRRPESPAKDPQESAYRKWLRSIGGKIRNK